MSDRSTDDFPLLSLIMTSICILRDFELYMSKYIWLLLKLFLGHVYEQEKCVYKCFWLSFNALKKKS